MLKLLKNCTHLTCYQRNVQNSPSQASTVCEPWTSRCSSWKRQRNQRSNCQHPLDHWKYKRLYASFMISNWKGGFRFRVGCLNSFSEYWGIGAVSSCLVPGLGWLGQEKSGPESKYFQLFKLDLEKAKEPEIKLPTSTGSLKKQESSRKTSTSNLLNTQKPLTVWITTNCGKFWKRWEYQTTWPASWEICMQVRKEQLDMEWNRLVPNRKRSTSRLYIVILLI